MQISRFFLISLTVLFMAAAFGQTSELYAKESTSAKSKQVSKSASVKRTVSKKSKSKRSASKRARRIPADRFAALVVDADTGRVLYEKNAGSIRYPASLTKMMTLYLTFDALKKGQLGMEQYLTVSPKAAKQPQTNIALDAGDRLQVRDAIESLVVRSANDSAMVLAETIGGTEWNFALMMTQKAHELGMKDTVFRNPSGLPDNKQHTTAYDMARLGIALKRDFPEYYPFFSLPSFTYNGITYPSHNRVMERYPGADGLKTGYIRASGFNLVTSVSRDGHRLVAVVLGGNTANSRDNQMVNLLDRTFARLATQEESMADSLNDNEPKSATFEPKQALSLGNPG
jgi:D-alanyl-D-alanine carboxypeptidase